MWDAGNAGQCPRKEVSSVSGSRVSSVPLTTLFSRVESTFCSAQAAFESKPGFVQ